MGQEEVLDFIESKNWLVSAREISQALGQEIYSVCHNLNKMIKYEEINFLELDRNEADLFIKDYKVGRRMRFFFSLKIPKAQMAQDLKAFLRSQVAESKTSK